MMYFMKLHTSLVTRLMILSIVIFVKEFIWYNFQHHNMSCILDVKVLHTPSRHIEYNQKGNAHRFQHGLNSLSTNPKKWSNRLQQFVSSCRRIVLSMFDHFVGLTLKGLKSESLESCNKWSYFEFWIATQR